MKLAVKLSACSDSGISAFAGGRGFGPGCESGVITCGSARPCYRSVSTSRPRVYEDIRQASTSNGIQKYPTEVITDYYCIELNKTELLQFYQLRFPLGLPT